MHSSVNLLYTCRHFLSLFVIDDIYADILMGWWCWRLTEVHKHDPCIYIWGTLVLQDRVFLSYVSKRADTHPVHRS